MTKLIITGARGKMGQALVQTAKKNPDLTVIAQINRGDDLNKSIRDADVVIDFTGHTGTAEYAPICAQAGKAMVIGTTGHDASEKEKLTKIAREIPVVLSANFSTGVNAMFWLTRKAAEILGPDFDLEVVETYHRLKKDSPGGTAQALASILAQVRQVDVEKEARYGRKGMLGARTATEIGVHSLRGGDVVGDHTVVFAGIGERLEVTHRASTRETFASGALRAAQWIVGKPPGLYDMQTVLGLK